MYGRIAGRVPVVVSIVALGLALAEGITRTLDQGALPRLAVFAEEKGRIALRRGAVGRLQHPTGRVTTVHTDADGCRIGGARGGWLAVGDSQVMGQGVADDETFAALASAQGLPVANCGVPGHGVADALDHASARAEAFGTRGVLVVVNQLNDWSEAGIPAIERLAVRGGFLVTRANADSRAGQLLASPLARSHVLLGLLLLTASSTPQAPPLALRDASASSQASALIASALRRFAEAHPALRTVAVLLPSDLEAAPERGARSAAWFDAFEPGQWAPLRASLATALSAAPVELVDLTPALVARPDAFLDADTHLSPTGHRLVARVLQSSLGAPR